MEQWKKIHPYYEVSNYGNVRSLDRVVTRSNGAQYTAVGRSISIKVGVNGYPFVVLIG